MSGSPPPLRQQAGQLLQQERKAHGMTQLDMAEKLGVTTRTIQRWEASESTIDLAELEVAGRTLGLLLLLVALPEACGGGQ